VYNHAGPFACLHAPPPAVAARLRRSGHAVLPRSPRALLGFSRCARAGGARVHQCAGAPPAGSAPPAPPSSRGPPRDENPARLRAP